MRPIITLFFFIFFSGLLVAQREIAFIADTQKPFAIEKFAKKNEHNEQATDSLFSSILCRKPAALFLLGDIVNNGSSSKSWKKIDAFLAVFRQIGIPCYAIQGNHEYMFRAKKGETNFQLRFGNLKNNINVQCIDSIAIVMINSNFGHLSAEETKSMLAQYALVMDSLQGLKTVESIIVCTHHAPYTNSKAVNPSKKVQQLIIPKYLSTPKANLFISGHAHLLELFREEGKYFCVIGGGGGIKQGKKTGNKQRYNDLLTNANHYRYFYCTAQLKNGALHFYIHGMNVKDWQECSEEVAIK